MLSMFEYADIESLKREQDQEFEPTFPSQVTGNTQNQIVKEEIQSYDNQLNLYRELLDEAQNENIALKQKLLEKEAIIEKYKIDLDLKSENGNTQENEIKLHNSEAEIEKLKQEISLLQSKEKELLKNMKTKKDQNMSMSSDTYEEKLKVQEEKIIQLESQLKEFRNKDLSRPEHHTKVNEFTLEAVQAELKNIEQKKKEIITFFPQLKQNEERNDPSLITNEEYTSLVQKLKLKEEEVTKYLKKIEMSEELIRSLEEKIKSIMKENQSNSKQEASEIENLNEKGDLVNQNLSSDSQKNMADNMNKLYSENNSLKIELKNLEKKYLECKALVEKKDSIVLEASKSETLKGKQNISYIQQNIQKNLMKNNPVIYGTNRIAKVPIKEYQNIVNPSTIVELNEGPNNLPEINDKFMNKKEIKTPILNKQFENSYNIPIPINRMKFGGKTINQSQNELFTQSYEGKPEFLDYKIQGMNNKWSVLNSVIKNQPIPTQNQVKRNYLPYIPTSIPDLIKRSINKNYEHKGLNHSEIIGTGSKFTTPSPPKAKRPPELVNRCSPVKDLRSPIKISSTITGICATKINSKNFYVQAKKY